MTGQLRCAVYTRKSSEEGLEQDFNSLHAQREACEAFILSQRHEGWKLVDAAYNDGGISGGTMNRPGIQRLLDDIRDGKIDIIVVYKVDRLTRSLADFARMVELFDKQGVSFVSVTQQFNTTSSMGRLTLNVLLSFAQFEREVTGERIRDKIRASKAKGIFMGGRVPRGYEVKERRLLILEEEAKVVRLIFSLYLELGCVARLKQELERQGIRGRHDAQGNPGATLSRGALYDMLRNPVYIGDIRHKEQIHKGQHAALLDKVLWQKVQKLLDTNGKGRRTTVEKKTEVCHLIGKICDDSGDSLTPSHTIKKGKRYRYYISRRLTTRTDATGWRLPARALEQAVLQAVQFVLKDLVALSRTLASRGLTTVQLAAALKDIRHNSEVLSQATLFERVVETVQLRDGAMMLTLNISPLLSSAPSEPAGCYFMTQVIPMELKRRGVEMRLVLETRSNRPSNVDPVLVRTVARAHTWFEDLLNGRHTSLREIAQQYGVSKSYVGDVLKLAFLAPDIVEAIVAGHQPAHLVSDHLTKVADLPYDWQIQRAYFGFK